MNRKKAAFVLAIVLLIPMLSGCSAAYQLNNQAYVMSLGIDRMETGELRVCVMVATIGSQASSSAEQGGSEKSEERISSALGGTFSEALRLIQATVQRPLNLSQLMTIVVSQDVATEIGFRDLLQSMIQTHRLYSAAELIICMGKAMELVMEQKPIIGQRLSNTIPATLELHRAQGYIPDSKLADVFYMTESVYSDPLATLAATASGKNFRSVYEGDFGDAYPGALPRTGDNKNEYFGSALFKDGQMVGALTGLETLLRNMLSGDAVSFLYSIPSQTIQVRVGNGPRVYVDLTQDAPVITVQLDMKINNILGTETKVDVFTEQMKRDLNNLTAHCQSLSVEPFSFAERAAMKFASMDDWIAYEWDKKFAKAEVRYNISIVQR